jgi:3-oxoacyl-[acyl-carrier-protein] synthase-3
MTTTSNFNAQIVGTGAYLPDKVLTNFDLEKTLDTSDEWIRTRTGIEERRIASEEESASTMAAKAGREALADAQIEADALDMIIVCTSTPDIIFPATACFVQKELGSTRAAAFDVSAVCSGFVFGLSIAEQFIKNGQYKNVLVIGSEVNSRIMDWTDRSTCILFGDGAGAAVVQRSESSEPKGVLSSHIYSDGRKADVLCVPGGIGKTRINNEAVNQKQFFLKMEGQAVFKNAVKRMVEVTKEALKHNSLKSTDVALLIPHQANIRIIEAVSGKIGLEADQVFTNIQKYGNTSAASIPIAMHEARKSGRINSGDISMLTVLGAGLTWGAVAIKW